MTAIIVHTLLIIIFLVYTFFLLFNSLITYIGPSSRIENIY